MFHLKALGLGSIWVGGVCAFIVAFCWLMNHYPGAMTAFILGSILIGASYCIGRILLESRS